MHHHTELSFVDEFRWFSPLHYLKNRWKTLFLFGAYYKRGSPFYTTTAPSCCIRASYCHLSATLQNTSIIVVNLEDNRAVFQVFITLLSFNLTLLLIIFFYIHQLQYMSVHSYSNHLHPSLIIVYTCIYSTAFFWSYSVAFLIYFVF